MSNIESFSPADQIIRRSGIELPRTGITESLLSPGVIAAQSQESPLTAQIAAAIGATAQLAGTTVQVLARDKALDEREQSDLDRAAAGRAAIDAGVVLPGLATSIAEGQHDELLDDPESFARAIAAEQGGDEFPEAYNEEMFSRLAPALSELAQKRKGVIVGQARAEQSENVIAGVRGSTDLAAIDASISAIRTINPSLSEDAAADYVLDDLMKYAVAVSETDPRRATEMLKTARMRAGDRLKTEQEVAQSRYHSNVHAYRQRTNQSLRNAVSSVRVSGGSFARQREEAAKFTGQADPDQIDVEIRQIGHLEEQALNNARSGVAEIFHQQQRERYFSHVVEHMVGARTTGGNATLQDHTYTDPVTGKPVTIKASEVAKVATDSVMKQIQKEAGDDPALAIDEQVKFLASNGVTYDPWKQTINAGYLGMASDFATGQTDAKGKKIEPSKNAIDGYRLFKIMGAKNPRLRDEHANSNAAQFYELAEIAEKWITPGDEAAALGQAATVFSRGVPSVNNPIEAKNVAAAVEEFDGFRSMWATDVKNEPAVRAEVHRLAKFYSAQGVPADVAVTEAGKKIGESYTNINGWAVYTKGISVPERASEIVADIAERYVADHPEEGRKASNLSLQPGEQTGTWILFDNVNMEPVETNFVLTRRSLFDLGTKFAAEHQAKTTEEIVRRNNQQNETRYPDMTNSLTGPEETSRRITSLRELGLIQ